ncbi:interleukin 17a/f3 isoform X2 [Melanotaenia boesemani]|nr:interleukin 17a/f3 isoform X2 [Melanotaenia boesemani]XP_041832201.1 interleukin 17a/f3 isoform X2 [Melanotaenia boesemani]
MRDGSRSRGANVKLVLDTSILPDLSRKSVSDIANMSLSPWIYRDSCDASRLPRRISQAHCLTSGCLSPLGGQEDLTLEVKPIQYQILVLHRVPKQIKKTGKRTKKKYEFVLGTEVVTVGCTCVRPAIIPQQ